MKNAAILLLLLLLLAGDLTPAKGIVDRRGTPSDEKIRRFSESTTVQVLDEDVPTTENDEVEFSQEIYQGTQATSNSFRHRELQTETLENDKASSVFSLTAGNQIDFVYTATVQNVYALVTCDSYTGTVYFYVAASPNTNNPATDTPVDSLFQCGVTDGPYGPYTIGQAYIITIYAASLSSLTTATLTVSQNTPISTPAPTPAATPAPVNVATPMPTCDCFSESATVQVLDKEAPVEMKELKVGQQIFAGMNENSGKPHYETVYGFAHRDEDQHTEYLRITTSSSFSNKKAGTNSTLEITSNHLIFLQDKKDPVPAGSLQVGDVLIRQSTNQKEAESATITGIKVIRQRGLYAPLTKDGTIIVDGFHASAYVSIQQSVPRVIGATTKVMSEQSFFHWWMAPYRVFCNHVAPKLCMDDYNEEEGYINWLVLGKGLAEIAQDSSNLIMVVGLAVVLSFCGAFMLLESLIEKAIFWFLLIAGGGFFWWQRLPSNAEKQHKKVP